MVQFPNIRVWERGQCKVEVECGKRETESVKCKATSDTWNIIPRYHEVNHTKHAFGNGNIVMNKWKVAESK